MNKRKLALGATGLVVALVFLTRDCGGPSGTDVATAVNSLKPNETSHVVVTMKGLTEVRRDDGQTIKAKTRYIPPEGGVVITTERGSDRPIVRPIVRGLTARVGVAVYYGVRATGGLDVKWLYWNRFGAVAGIGLLPKLSPPYIGASFNFYNNTAVFVGIDTKKQPVVGVRISF